LTSFIGSGIEEQYNISGAELFLGEESNTKREITANVQQYSLSELYSDFMGGSTSDKSGENQPITDENSIRDLMGDNDGDTATVNTSYFYIRGTKSDGTTINEKISMTDSQTVNDLLKNIGDIYGNTPDADVVNVSLNDVGQIMIEDKVKGSSKLDFHMVGAVDYSGAGNANVNQINDLDDGETDFSKIVNGTSTAAEPDLYVKEFVKSSYDTVAGVGTNNNALVYDRTQFSKDGTTITSDVAQIVTDGNAYATAKTKLSEVADLSQGTTGTLDGTAINLVGNNTSGAAYSATINLNNTAGGGSSFTIGGNTYDIFNMDSMNKALTILQ